MRELIEQRLPPLFRDKGIWLYVALTLRKAAQGRVGTAEVHAALTVALELEQVDWRSK